MTDWMFFILIILLSLLNHVLGYQSGFKDGYERRQDDEFYERERYERI